MDNSGSGSELRCDDRCVAQRLRGGGCEASVEAFSILKVIGSRSNLLSVGETVVPSCTSIPEETPLSPFLARLISHGLTAALRPAHIVMPYAVPGSVSTGR